MKCEKNEYVEIRSNEEKNRTVNHEQRETRHMETKRNKETMKKDETRNQ